MVVKFLVSVGFPCASYKYTLGVGNGVNCSRICFHDFFCLLATSSSDDVLKCSSVGPSE